MKGEPHDGEEKKEEKDTRTVRNIYEGRVYSKHTQPMKPYAPKRKISTNVQPDQKRAKEENVEFGTEDIDEIQKHEETRSSEVPRRKKITDGPIIQLT